jgi:hypothetical protein
MTPNQEYYLGLYLDNANQAYSLMRDARVDYDTYKPIADSSLLKTEQAKKMYEKLYVIYINYPVFLNGLKNIYNTSKEQSDLENFYLTEKQNRLNSLKSKYDSWIEKINELQVQIDIDILSQTVQNIADDPRSLEKSDELVIEKKKADDEAARIAAEKAAEAAENAKNTQTEIIKDIITGSETCVDKDGNIIDMSICRPSSGGGGSGEYVAPKETASQIFDKNVDSWLDNIIKQVTPIVEPPAPIIAAPSPPIETPTIETPKEEPKKEETTTTNEEVKKEETPETEDIINSLIFDVDLSKLISNKTEGETLIEVPLEDSLGLGLGSGGPNPMGGGGFEIFDPFSPIGLGSDVSNIDLPKPVPVPTPIVKEEIKKSTSSIKPIQPIVVADVNQPILKTVDIKSMTPIYLGAGLVSALIVYNIWKKKD